MTREESLELLEKLVAIGRELDDYSYNMNVAVSNLNTTVKEAIEKLNYIPEGKPFVSIDDVEVNKQLITINYSNYGGGDAEYYEWTVNGEVADDKESPLEIPIGSKLANKIGKIHGEFTGDVFAKVVAIGKDGKIGGEDAVRFNIESELGAVPIPTDPPPPPPPPPPSPVEDPNLKRFVQLINLSEPPKIYVLPEPPNDKRYGSSHPALGFGANANLTILTDHGGYAYSPEGKFMGYTGLHGGFTARQWDSKDPYLAWGFIDQKVFAIKFKESTTEVTSLAQIQKHFPSLGIETIFAGVNEGHFVRGSYIYLTGINYSHGRGYLFKVSMSGYYDSPIEIPQFNWRSGRPDYGSCAIIDNYFYYKAVLQNTENTKTPWIIVDAKEEDIYRSASTMLRHSCPFVLKDKGNKMVDAIAEIGGYVTRMSDGLEVYKFSRLNSGERPLDFHIGALCARGQGWLITDGSDGIIRLCAPNDDGSPETYELVNDASGRNTDYVSGGLIDGKLSILYMHRDGKRRVATWTW